MDCGQGKINNNCNNGPATARGSDEGSGDVAIGQDGGRVGRARDEVEDAMGDTVSDVPIAIDGVNYPIDRAPHPIHKPARLRKCESIPPPHGATPPLSDPQSVRLRKCELIPPPHGATPPSSGPQLVRLQKCESIPPPHGATPPLSGPQSVRLRKCESMPPPHDATPPLGGQQSVSIPPPNGATPLSVGQQSVNWKVNWAVNDTPPTSIYDVTSMKRAGGQDPVIPQVAQTLEGLRPTILEQTGGFVTGAETDKLRLQNRRRRHALKEQQVPATLWTTHTGHASLPTKHERPIKYCNKMCLAGIATSHPAGDMLVEWSQLGCPTKMG